MTKLLLRLFAKKGDRSSVGRLSGIVGVVSNLLLAGSKLVVGILSGSVAITADAMNNLSDATSSVITFVGFKLAEQPADKEHPYGHARYEYISALVVAAVILLIGFELGKSSLEKIIHPQRTNFSLALVLILTVSIFGKMWLFLFNRKLGKDVESQALLATAADSRNDAIATTAVLVSAIIEKYSGWTCDGYMGLAVSIFIFISGIRLVGETISPLLGEGASEEMQTCIVDYISSNPKVLGYHDLYVHDYGPGRRFASLHVEMDCKEDPLVCHELIDDMERECMASHGIQLVIHYDPVVTDDPEISRLHNLIDESLRNLDLRLSTHDFRMVQGKHNVNLIFDIVLPDDLRKQENAIREHLQTVLAAEDKSYFLVVTFDSAAFVPRRTQSK